MGEGGEAVGVAGEADEIATMKVNIIIRIEDCENTEQSMETEFEGCETDDVVKEPDLKLLHSLIKRYEEVFGAPAGY